MLRRIILASLILIVGGVFAFLGSRWANTYGRVSPITFGDFYSVSFAETLQDSGDTEIKIMKNKPEVRFQKWGGEVDMAVSYNKVQAEASKSFFSDKVEWKGGKEEVHAYPLKAKAGLEDGGFEIEVVLNEKPSTNQFSFQIDNAENLNFFYQYPLDQELNDPTCTPTDCQGKHRPENVVGSYAVYHKTNKDHIIGQANYATGKVFHIYRPKAFDARGREQWSNLSYSGGVLSVTVPQEFLDSATYPVIVDPTFGYTTIAGSSALVTPNEMDCTLGLPANSANVDSVTAYLRTDSGTANFKGMIALASTKTIVTDGITPASASYDTTPAWQTVNYSTKPSVTGGTNYYVCAIWNAASYIVYDTGGAADEELYDGTNSYATPTSPTDGTNFDAFISYYATYTDSSSSPHVKVRGGGASSNPSVKIRGGTSNVSGSSAFVQSNALCIGGDCESNPSATATITLNGVTAGNLIVVYLKWEGTNTTVTVCDDGTTCAAGHAFTEATGTRFNHSNGDLNGAFFYLLSSTSGNKTYTATLGASRPYIRMHVWEESYTGTATFNTGNSAQGTTSLSSGNITTTGSGSWVAFGAYGEYNTDALSNHQINGQAADQTETPSGHNSATWREPFSSTFTGAATATGASNPNIAHVAAFNFAGASSGGGGSVKFR